SGVAGGSAIVRYVPGPQPVQSHQPEMARSRQCGGVRFALLTKGDVMPTSILITGGTGTLGRPVALRLRDAGADVTVLSRHPRDTVDGIRYATGDLNTGEGVPAAVRGAEVVVHCAGS